MRYPNRLRECREARGLTQWEVCRVVDITLNRFGRMEKGITQPSYQEGVRLAAYFDADASYLFPVPVEQAHPAA